MPEFAERRRLAEQLHGGAQQQLSSAVIHLQLGDTEEALARLQEGIARLRSFAADLYPSVLTTHGLAAALGALADRLGVQARIDDRLGGERFAPDDEAAVYFAAVAAVRAARGPVRIVVSRAGDGPSVEVTPA